LVGFFHERSTRDVRYLYYTPQKAAIQLKAAERRMQKKIEERRQVLAKKRATFGSIRSNKIIQQQQQTAVSKNQSRHPVSIHHQQPVFELSTRASDNRSDLSFCR